MNRLTARLKALLGASRPLTAGQLTARECSLCGVEFRPGEGSAYWGWHRGIRRFRRCRVSCILVVVDEVRDLFEAAIPGNQTVDCWQLGVDGVVDTEHVAEIDGQPKRRVEIVHPDGILTTRPLPRDYAEEIAAQAQRLGFTAMIDEGAEA